MSLEKIVTDNTEAIRGLTEKFEALISQLSEPPAPKKTTRSRKSKAANDDAQGGIDDAIDSTAAKAAQPDLPGVEPKPEAPAKQAAKQAPTAAKAEAPADVTYEQVSAAWLALAKVKKAKAMVILGREFNARKVQDVDPADFPRLMAAITAAMPE